MRSSSPTRICFAGLARSPFNSTCPPSTSDDASERVLKNRAAQRHLSNRMPNRFAVLAPGSQVALALVALVALPACDRRQASADPADTARAASSDTIVRRVVRVYRAPSAIQRVTGAVSTMYAL